ncbi:MAG: glycosyltransferase [Planctomycetota bacterium]
MAAAELTTTDLPTVAFVLPTRNRPGQLATTLERIAAVGAGPSWRAIVVDNASSPPAHAPKYLRDRVEVVRLNGNRGTAARNIGVRRAGPGAAWIVMLDDDSWPIDAGFLAALRDMPDDVGAVMADVWLEPDADGNPRRESGGLPEVFVGCGVAIRREAYLALGGYDASFGYYAEEYDLAAKLLMAGWRTVFDDRFRVRHAKVEAGRDMNAILGRLVRNNGWVIQRYAPDAQLAERLAENERRYREIAEREDALAGYEAGLAELGATIASQLRTPMSEPQWDRFTGVAAARVALGRAAEAAPMRTAAVVERGKNAWAVERALAEVGVAMVDEPAAADAVVIGTMSPGPMLDAAARWRGRHERVIVPWVSAAEVAGMEPVAVAAAKQEDARGVDRAA